MARRVVANSVSCSPAIWSSESRISASVWVTISLKTASRSLPSGAAASASSSAVATARWLRVCATSGSAASAFGVTSIDTLFASCSAVSVKKKRSSGSVKGPPVTDPAVRTVCVKSAPGATPVSVTSRMAPGVIATLPAACSRSVSSSLTCTSSVEPEAKEAEPTRNVSSVPPGEMRPPLSTVAVPATPPMPASVAPLLTSRPPGSVVPVPSPWPSTPITSCPASRMLSASAVKVGVSISVKVPLPPFAIRPAPAISPLNVPLKPWKKVSPALLSAIGPWRLRVVPCRMPWSTSVPPV